MVQNKHMNKMIKEMAAITVLAKGVLGLFKEIEAKATLKYGESQTKYGENDSKIRDALSKIYTHANKILAYSASKRALVTTISMAARDADPENQRHLAFKKIQSIVILVRESGGEIFEGAKELKKAMPKVADAQIENIKTKAREIRVLARMERRDGKKSFREIVQTELEPAFA